MMIFVVKFTYFDFNVTLNWSTVNFDAASVFVNPLHGSIKDFIVKRFERDYVKTNFEDDVSSSVLNYTCKIILLL